MAVRIASFVDIDLIKHRIFVCGTGGRRFIVEYGIRRNQPLTRSFTIAEGFYRGGRQTREPQQVHRNSGSSLVARSNAAVS